MSQRPAPGDAGPLWYDSSALGGRLCTVSGTTRPLPRARHYGDDRRADVLALNGTTLTRYDSHADLLPVDSDGVTWLNPGTGNGTFGSRVRVGSGWTGRTLS